MREEYIDNLDRIKEMRDLEKYANYFFLMHYWMRNIEEGKKLDVFFDNRGYKNVAIYGVGYLGEHFITQISNKYGPVYTIDRGVVRYKGVECSLEDFRENASSADVIVVTPVTEYESIKETIKKYVEIDVVSLEEVILSM